MDSSLAFSRCRPCSPPGGHKDFLHRLKLARPDAGQAGLKETEAGCTLARIKAVPARQVPQALADVRERGGAVHWHCRLLSPAVAVHAGSVRGDRRVHFAAICLCALRGVARGEERRHLDERRLTDGRIGQAGERRDAAVPTHERMCGVV